MHGFVTCQTPPKHWRRYTSNQQVHLIHVINIKQGQKENPQIYYNRLLQVFFGIQNEEGMVENKYLKELLIYELHPYTKHHLGLQADLNLRMLKLRELS